MEIDYGIHERNLFDLEAIKGRLISPMDNSVQFPEILHLVERAVVHEEEQRKIKYKNYQEYRARIEQEKIDKIAAEKKKVLDSYLSKMTKSDKDRALDLWDKLSRLRSGTTIYDEYEIELRKLFRFYDSI